VQLTKGGDTYKFGIYWSPDSKKILWTDKKLRLFYVDVASKKSTLVNQAKEWEIRDAVWSPDSRWIAWSQQEANGLSRLYLYSLEKKQVHPVTAGRYSSHGPAFSGDGKYLFFASDRDFHPIYSATEWNHAYRDMARIYLVTLARDTPDPFRPRSDEPVKKAEAKPAAKEAEAKGKGKDDVKKGEAKGPDKEEQKPLSIDVEGIGERILRLPVKPARYRNLQSVGAKVFYIRSGSRDSKPALQVYDVEGQKETALGSVNGFEISADGKKMLVSQGGKYAIIDLPKGTVSLSKPLNLSGMEMQLDHHAEWQQIFNESWRQMRDFFYDPNMHGVDWKAMRERYAPLVPYVNHRADLTYVIGEMVAELNVGHTYVSGGEMPHPRRIPLGHLGAYLKKDPKSGYFRIEKILRGPRWNPDLQSPLDALGVNAKKGDFILEVNGKSTAGMANIYEALVNTVGKQVTLKINGTPAEKGAREVVVVPIGNEADLIYHEWVEGNLKKVSEATGGKVGYLHVPDMGPAGLNQFARYFYPQTDKKALIIDIRGNGGGNVSPMLIERLRRHIAMITIARNTAPGTNPSEMIWGPMVCLMDEFSASDGDLFPWRFRHHKLGKLVGKRSWGGVVGIRGSLPLLDGGDLRRPEFSRYDVTGKKWIIEGHGVDPDIVVDNDPAKEFAGEDQQLNRAIEELEKELKNNEKEIPPPPPYPKR
jgi:tricorn protease